MRRLAMVAVALVALGGLLAFPAVVAANGAVHLTGGGDPGNSSVRMNSANVDLACLGVSAGFGDFTEVTTTNEPWSDRLVVDGAGHAHIRLIVRGFTFAVYPAPGPNGPNPGDPGYLFSGSVKAMTIETKRDQLTPNQPGEVTTVVSIPITMRSGDGTVTSQAFYDVLIVIGVDSSGAPLFIASAPVGGRCP